MSKYIVKNCPGLLKDAGKWAKGFKEDEYFCNEGEGKWCQDCTDCVMKQIVEKCKYWQNRWTDDIDERYGFDQIIELFDIQEVE